MVTKKRALPEPARPTAAEPLPGAVDKVRRMEAKVLKAKEPELLKGTRYLRLKNPWNLTPTRKQRLGYIQSLNLKIHKADLLKRGWGQKSRKLERLFRVGLSVAAPFVRQRRITRCENSA